MMKNFSDDLPRWQTPLLLLLLMAAIAVTLIFAPTTAYAESLGPYKGYQETDGIVFTDVNGNVLTSESVIDINLFQQGVWVYRPMWYGEINTDVGSLMAWAGTDATEYKEGIRAAGGGGESFRSNPAPYRGYYVYHALFKVLATNTTYTLRVSSSTTNYGQNGPYPESVGHIFYQTTVTITTGGQRDSTINSGEGDSGKDSEAPGSDLGGKNTNGASSEGADSSSTDQNADTGNTTPQTGSSSNHIKDSYEGTSLAPNAASTDSTYNSPNYMNTGSSGEPDTNNSTGAETSSGDGQDMTTAAEGRSTGESNVSGEVLASMGTVHKVGEAASSERSNAEEAHIASLDISMVLSGLPYLYMLFMGILIASLPLGLLKRILGICYRQVVATRIN